MRSMLEFILNSELYKIAEHTRSIVSYGNHIKIAQKVHVVYGVRGSIKDTRLECIFNFLP